MCVLIRVAAIRLFQLELTTVLRQKKKKKKKKLSSSAVVYYICYCMSLNVCLGAIFILDSRLAIFWEKKLSLWLVVI